MRDSPSRSPSPSSLTTVTLTVVAMIAFAANSILCRMALGQGLIDASSFASVRVASGAVMLLAEAVTPRLVIASAATLGGVAIVLLQRSRKKPPQKVRS